MASHTGSTAPVPPPRPAPQSRPKSRPHYISPMTNIEQTVTRLLMSTKKLLEGLTAWSQNQMTSQQIQALYSVLATHFLQAVDAFEAGDMDMSDVAHVPSDLQASLTLALEQTPSTSALEQHMPVIRDIILTLLKSLKQKQALMRDKGRPLSSSSSICSFSPTSPNARYPSPPDPTLPRSPTTASDPMAASLTTEVIDTTDSGARDALSALQRQDTLAHRSSVRRTGVTQAQHTSPQAPPRRRQKKASGPIPLFLQFGDQIKKACYPEETVTLDGLRQLFVQKFGLDAQGENIHIQDPGTHIIYQLEDVQEVVANRLLVLQRSESPEKSDYARLEHKLDALRQELQEKAEQWIAATATPAAVRDSNQENTQTCTPLPNSWQPWVQEQLATVDALQRDMCILRQVSQEFQQEITDILKQLTVKSTLLKQKPPSRPDEARQYILDTKTRTKETSTSITANLEDLQDTIDELKLDVTQRGCRPSMAQLQHCNDQVKKLEKEIAKMEELIQTAKPIWKSTWENELQTVVNEQQFLKEQENLLLDIKDDHTALVEVLQQLQKISEIQARHKSTRKACFVKPAGEGFEGMSSVLKQVESIEVDHHRRIKALQQAEKMRAREVANRIDAFEQELASFVDAKKLKKTGGADEIERQRQQKDKEVLKAIYQVNKTD